MRLVIPDWLTQSIWFVAGILATGAVWFFLSRKENVPALWSAFAAIVLVLFNIALMIHGDLVTRGKAEFRASLQVKLFFGYPSHLVYAHSTKDGRCITHVGLAAHVEVVNMGNRIARVRAYRLKCLVNGRWRTFPVLTVLNPATLFWVADGDLKKSIRLRVSTFDEESANTQLEPGQSIRGWMFFEWPKDLRSAIPPAFNRHRLVLEDVTGSQITLDLQNPKPQSPLDGGLDGGSWERLPGAYDLSTSKVCSLAE